MSTDLIRSIIEAVALDGFRPRLLGNGLELHGEIGVGSVRVPVQIRFEDLSFAASPRVYLPDTSMLARKVVPHLDDAGEFCVVNRQMFIFDRYRAPEQMRGLIVRAREVLERGMTKAGTNEIADEFVSYWSESSIEFPENSASVAKKAKAQNFAHVSTAVKLSFEPHHSKPTTLGELIDWANAWDKSLGGKILAALARLSARDPAVVIHAPNGTIVATLMVSDRGSKFVGTLSRQAAWERFLKTSAAQSLKIKRNEGRRTDLAKIFGANGPEGTAPLSGRKIVQIGCGAIGGYLARMLVQTGAGLDVPLTLIDPDLLVRSNVRRHQLGIGDLGRFKAEACAEAIGRDFPGVEIVSLTGGAQSYEAVLAAADMIIDATGEQEFSEWLNAWCLTRRKAGMTCPSLLFVWIAGSGAAVQSFLVIDDQHACYRCLQPDLTKPGRFDPLKEPAAEPVAACGEQPITPYGPAASTAAASLASSHVVDWALGRPHHLLRTGRIDWAATVKRDPKSPDRAGDCPACSV